MASDKVREKPVLPVDKGPFRILAVGCILIVAVMILMGVSSMQIIKQAVVSKLKTKDMVNLSKSYGAVIEEKIDRAVDASLLLSYDPELIRWIESMEKDDRAGQDVQDKMADLVERFGYETAFLTSNRTYHYWSYHDQKFVLLNTVDQNTPSDEWFFNTIAMKTKYAINIDYNAELKNTFVWINTLVGDTDQPIAATGLGMNLGNIIETLIAENIQKQTDNQIWLVNNAGTVQLATDQADMNKHVSQLLPSALAEQLSEKQAGEAFKINDYSDPDGQLYDIAYRQIKNTDWKLVIQIPRAETTGFLSSVTWNIMLYGFGILLIVLILFLFLYHRLANPYKRAVKLNQELEELVALRTGELVEKNQKIQDSIDYARSIQQTIFPSNRELKSALTDYFVLFEPKDGVSGDFYWIKQAGSGKLLIVGDCTGHGVAGALMTTAVNAMLNQITEQIFDDPARILAALHTRIKEFAPQDSDTLITPYGLDAAVFYIADTGAVTYSGAALTAYLWDGVSVREAPGSSTTIDSMMRKRTPHFENYTLDQSSDLTFYAATDGFLEQPGGPKGLPLGKTHFLDLLTQIAPLPMAQQQAAFRQALLDYQGNELRRDDVTVLGFKM